MRGKLLLIADDAHFSELRDHGELPQSWLSDLSPDALLAGIEDESPWIARCRRDFLLPPGDAADDATLDRRERAELINNLLDGTIGYLAVVDGQSREELAEHAAWYERFRREVEDRAKARHVHLRHVLILVCRDDPRNDRLAEFQRLVAGSGGQQLFDLCYVMMEELEPGRGPGTFFHAAHVWPMAVGGLLLKLLHDRRKPRAGQTRAYAWRCYHLSPEISSRDQRRLCFRQFTALFDRLTSDTSIDHGWNPTCFTRFAPLSETLPATELAEPDARDGPASQGWLEGSAPADLERIKAEHRWEESLTRAGDALGRQLSQQAIGRPPAASLEAAKIWNSVHRDPRFIYAALADRDLMRGPSLEDQFETMKTHWEKILEKDRQREALIEEADGCARHLEAAKNAYVNVTFRLLIVFAVTLFVGYVSMLVLHALLGTWGVPALVALAGAVGALTAGFFTFDREQAAGRRAKYVFEEQLDAIDQKVVERDECCQNAVASANVFWQQMWAKAAANQLKPLLRRVQLLFDRELRYRPDPSPQGEPGAPRGDEPTDATAPSDRGVRQGWHYRRATRLQQVVDLADLGGVGQDYLRDLGDFIEDQVEVFRGDLWLAFCERHDRGRHGNLPARHLIPALRGFRDRFQDALLMRVRRLAIKRLHARSLAEWGEQLRGILDYQQYFELMSCRILAHQTAREQARPLPRLYLRRGFDYRDLMNYLDSATLAGEPEISTYLEDLPIVGFLFQEMPVQFCGGEKGTITLAPYHDQDRYQDEA